MKNKEFDGIKYFEVNESTVRGFDKDRGHMISIEALPEHMDAVDYWYKETDCFANKGLAAIFARKSENPFWFCVVRVTVQDLSTFKEGTDYLGACNYENGLSFIDYGYFPDMVERARLEVISI